jgi:hypothetical protein
MTYEVQKVSITHDAIIDFVITKPQSTYREIANAFGYSPEGIGVICRSDSFKARLEVRKDALVDPIIRQNVEERLTGLAHASIDILQRKLAVSDDPGLALKTLDIATKVAAAQYGARNMAGPAQTTFVVHMPGPASNSAEWTAKFGRVPLVVEEATLSTVRGVDSLQDEYDSPLLSAAK